MTASDVLFHKGYRINGNVLAVNVVDANFNFDSDYFGESCIVNDKLDIPPHWKVTLYSNGATMETCYHDFKSRPDRNIIFSGGLTILSENYGDFKPFVLYIAEIEKIK